MHTPPSHGSTPLPANAAGVEDTVVVVEGFPDCVILFLDGDLTGRKGRLRSWLRSCGQIVPSERFAT